MKTILKDFVLEKIEYYSKQMNIPVTTDVIFDLDEWAEYYKNNHIYYKSLYKLTLIHHGANYNHGKRLFINLGIGAGKRELENTIIHELIHTKYIWLKHGFVFNSYIKQIKKGKEPKIPWYGFMGKIIDPIDNWLRE